MKAVVWRGVGDIALEDVPEPTIREPTDAIVAITRSAVCGTDLHMVRGTLPGMKPGTILGHEAVGVVTEVGSDVRNFTPGHRVVVASTIGCGTCSYCRAGYFAQCDRANPNGPAAGTSFFGGPASTGPIDGLQAEYARIPFAATTLVRVPDNVTDDQAILVSDIFPTGWFGARLAEVTPGDTVCVLGGGIVGQFAIASAKLQNAGRVLAVDGIASRLAMAREQNAEVIDFNTEDPIAAVRELTDGIGADRVVEAVGIDAQRPTRGPAAAPLADQADRFDAEVTSLVAQPGSVGDTWVPGNAPSLATSWAIEAAAKAGTVGIIGVYPPTFRSFAIGEAMGKNLTINVGNCNHRRYLPRLLTMVASGAIDPAEFISHHKEPVAAVEAYQAFDRREDGWLKVVLDVA